MASGLKNTLTRQIGEHLVTAELGRRQIIATPFAGNIPEIDILAYANGKSIPIQVKAISNKSTAWQFQITEFLEIEFKGNRQVVKRKNKNINRKLICIFVNLGTSLGVDEFYIFKKGWLQNYFFKNYKGGIRTKNPMSLHCAIQVKGVKNQRERWDVLEKELGVESNY